MVLDKGGDLAAVRREGGGGYEDLIRQPRYPFRAEIVDEKGERDVVKHQDVGTTHIEGPRKPAWKGHRMLSVMQRHDKGDVATMLVAPGEQQMPPVRCQAKIVVTMPLRLFQRFVLQPLKDLSPLPLNGAGDTEYREQNLSLTGRHVCAPEPFPCPPRWGDRPSQTSETRPRSHRARSPA